MMKTAGITSNKRLRSFLAAVRKHKLHLVMIVPVLAQFIIFKYLPLYGILLPTSRSIVSVM